MKTMKQKHDGYAIGYYDPSLSKWVLMPATFRVNRWAVADRVADTNRHMPKGQKFRAVPCVITAHLPPVKAKAKGKAR